MDYEDKESPFQPGFPVSPDYFMGRKKIVDKILRYVPKVYKGNPQHYFITGKKGMGKTSLAKYVQNLSNDKLLEVYISNKGNDSLEILTNQIIEGILSKIPKNSALEKAKNIFGSIDNLEFNGAKVNFKPKSELSKNIINDFAYYLNKFYKDLPNNKGIFLVIDDINGFSESKEFANWYKRLVDIMTVNDEYNIPIYFLLAGYPEKFNQLVLQDESFARIFRYDNLDNLSDDEVKDFFIDMFKSQNISINPDALNLMTEYSSGLPLMMQEIGEDVFWATDTNNVSLDNAIEGIIEAGEIIGRRQIKPVMDSSIRSKTYNDIFSKLGEYGKDFFRKSEFEKHLNNTEKKAFPNFLKRATELNILESVGKDKSGEYKFSNKLYLLYFMILNLNSKR